MQQRKNITPEEEKWLLSVGWKKHTLTQLADMLDCSPTPIKRILEKYDLTAMTKRELIAAEILKKYGTEIPLNVHELAVEFNISDVLMKCIIDDYGIVLTEKPTISVSRTIKLIKPIKKEDDYTDSWLEKLKQRDDRIKKIKEARSAFTYYTQTGTDLTDSLRGIRTTKRV